MSSYIVQHGDTFETISRKAYGDESGQRRIATANPGAFEPLLPGTVLAIPPNPNGTRDRPQQIDANGVNEAALILNGERFRFWESVTLVRTIDAVDAIEFSAPFDPTVPAQREAFRPFTYPGVEFTVGGVRMFNGTAVNMTAEVSADSKTVVVGGYSLPGVLSDCMLPAAAYPQNEFENQTLEDIARSIASHYGLSVKFEGPVGGAFDREAIDIGRKCMEFLSTLATQRGLVIGSDPDGALVFRQSKPVGRPVAILQEGVGPLVSVSPLFKPQQYYSHVTCVEPVIPGTEGIQYTALNTLLRGVVRPYSFKAADVTAGAIPTAAEAKLGRMFGNMANYTVTVNTWRDSNGSLWEPNTTVELLAPSAMVYNPYRFIVRGVVLERNAQTEVATLDLVLPGAFDGKKPESLPWD